MRVWIALACSSVALPVYADEADCADCSRREAIAIEAAYVSDVWHNASGGAATGTRYLDNLDLTFDLDGELLFGVEGLRLFSYALYNNGLTISELAGAAQGVSNIEATRALRMYELWTQWEFGNRPGSLRFGLYDLNSEFDSIETAGLFINPSHGIGPDFSQSGENGPSIFPTTSLGLRMVTTHDQWTLQAAVLDGVPGDVEHPDRASVLLSHDDGVLMIGEANYRFESGVRLGGGYWQYTGDFDHLPATDAAGDAHRRDNNAGAYLLIESQTLFAKEADRGMNLFLRTGFAGDSINAIGRYYGGGAVYTGWSARRPSDQIGIAVAVAELGDPYRQALAQAGALTATREYNYELTYRFEVSDWLTLQSDLQYIRHPGMDPTMDSAWVVGLRLELSRGWAW